MRSTICAFALGSLLATPSLAANSLDKEWNELIAQTKKHGGVETVLDQTASYVLQAKDGTYVAFTRTLDNKKRFICIIRDALNFRYCYNFDSQTVVYGTRANADAPWVESLTPPPPQEKQPSFWDGLLQAFLSLPLASPRQGGGGYGPHRVPNFMNSSEF